MDAHNSQMRKLRSESKVTSVTQPMAEPGLGSTPPTSVWSRTVITVQLMLRKWSADYVDQPRGDESQDRGGSFCSLSFEHLCQCSVLHTHMVNVWCLDISCLTSIYRWGNRDKKMFALPSASLQSSRAVGYIGGTDSYTVVWKLPCKDKAHFTLDFSSLLMFPSPQQDKELCSLRGHIYLVLHRCSRQSTVHDT